MFSIVNNNESWKTIDIKQINNRVKAALNLLDIKGKEFTIAFETDYVLQSLNKKYRNIDAATDVLSFQSDVINPETGNKYLGDIVISLDRTSNQANEKGHLFEKELLTLIVHGLLHLLGHDHFDEEEEKVMFDLQNKVVAKVIGN